MMNLVRMEDRGLVVLPTHRIVRGLAGFDREVMLEGARRFFEITRIDLRTENRSATTLLEEAGENGTAFVAVTRQGPYLLRAKKRPVAGALKEGSAKQSRLGVGAVHEIQPARLL